MRRIKVAGGMDNYVSIWPVLILALIHFFGTRLRFLEGLPRSVWLSLAGGVSVAYVFLHLFPEFSEGQAHIEESGGLGGFLEHHVYLMALIGLAFFYGLERAVIEDKQDQGEKGKAKKPTGGVFWVHMGSFAIYNALIGYLLFQREEGALQEMVLFSIAMALHFIVNDYALQEHHKERYKRIGRWVLVVALIAGWVVGYLLQISESAVALLLAFVGGGVILNVMKEELPEERASRYWAFALGAGSYATLLLSL